MNQLLSLLIARYPLLSCSLSPSPPAEEPTQEAAQQRRLRAHPRPAAVQPTTPALPQAQRGSGGNSGQDQSFLGNAASCHLGSFAEPQLMLSAESIDHGGMDGNVCGRRGQRCRNTFGSGRATDLTRNSQRRQPRCW